VTVQPEETTTTLVRPKKADFKTEAAFQRALKKFQRQQREQRQNTVPLNEGTATPISPDDLNIELLGEGPAFIRRLVTDVPELQQIFEKHYGLGSFEPNNSVGIQNFKNDILDSEWMQERSDDAIKAWALERTRPEEFNRRKETAKVQLKRIAVELGIPEIPEDVLEELASDWLYRGWDREDRRLELNEILGKRVDFQDVDGRSSLRGQAGDIAESLQTIAQRNGLRLNEDYFLGAARSIISGLQTLEDVERDLREQAAGMWPAFGDRIRAGENAMDLASGYINLMAQEFEIDPSGINLDDPFLMQAFGGLNQEGQPQLMSLWDFRTKLREDPRWMNTLNAQNSIADIGNSVLRMFGMVG
jgi:hypothetical protein